MNKLTQIKEDLKVIISCESRYNFPDFITKLRKAMCVSRQQVVNDLQVDYLKLFYVEIGCFNNPISSELIDDLADYFGVNKNLMHKKLDSYVSKRKSL